MHQIRLHPTCVLVARRKKLGPRNFGELVIIGRCKLAETQLLHELHRNLSVETIRHVQPGRGFQSPQGRLLYRLNTAVPAVLRQQRPPAETAPADPPSTRSVETADYPAPDQVQDDRAGQEPI